jgi:hypothetical protein
LIRLENEPEPGEIQVGRDGDNPKPGVFEIIEPAYADDPA